MAPRFARFAVALVAVLASLSPSAPALAQATHLNVPVKQMVTVLYSGIWDPSTSTFTPGWAEIRNGVRTDFGKSYSVPRGLTLVVTDVDVTIRCLSASGSTPLLSTTMLDPGGTPLLFLSRHKAVLTSPGREQDKATFTSGFAVPEGFQLYVDPIDPAAVPTHYVMRAAFVGYYAE